MENTKSKEDGIIVTNKLQVATVYYNRNRGKAVYLA
jgi:hypothetical protein